MVAVKAPGATAIDSGRRTRRDALPEHTHYADTGCDLHPACLTCPFVRCRYDEPGGHRRRVSRERDRGILAMQRDGYGISVIARRFAISRRTVFRVLARSRNEEQERGTRDGGSGAWREWRRRGGAGLEADG